MNTKLSATAFVHWHWIFSPERKLIFTNGNTPSANQIEDRPNSAIVTWKRSWLLHKYNWRALWQLIIQGKMSMPIQLNKKTRTIPLPSVGNFTLASQMWSTRTLAIYHCRQKRSTPIHLSRKELSTPLTFRRKIFASFTKASWQHSGHCSRKSKKLHPNPHHQKTNKTAWTRSARAFLLLYQSPDTKDFSCKIPRPKAHQ